MKKYYLLITILVLGLLATGIWFGSINALNPDQQTTEVTAGVSEKLFYHDATTGFQIISTPAIEGSGYSVTKAHDSYYADNSYDYTSFIPAFDEVAIKSFTFGIVTAIPIDSYEPVDCTNKNYCLEPIEVGRNSSYVFTYSYLPPNDAWSYCLNYPGRSDIPLPERTEFTESNKAWCTYYDELRRQERELEIFRVVEPL